MLASGALCGCGYLYSTQKYEGEQVRINISDKISDSELKELIVSTLGEGYGKAVYRIWKLRKGTVSHAHGSYVVKFGEPAYKLAMRLRGGLQDPVVVTILNSRSLETSLKSFSKNMEFEYEDLRLAFDNVMSSHNIPKEHYPAYLLPDTYQFYWTSSATTVAERLYKFWNSFWTQERIDKASRHGLTPVEVSTIASIVEEESAKIDERPIIARLYLNRLKAGMKLQADPTVKYAVGDPTLKRILNVHLSTQSPYNTYVINGLPPGPIRIVDKATIDAVLNAPSHSYLYMCAREDFSGYHNFSTSLSVHNANARKYHDALNRLNIK